MHTCQRSFSGGGELRLRKKRLRTVLDRVWENQRVTFQEKGAKREVNSHRGKEQSSVVSIEVKTILEHLKGSQGIPIKVHDNVPTLGDNTSTIRYGEEYHLPKASKQCLTLCRRAYRYGARVCTARFERATLLTTIKAFTHGKCLFAGTNKVQA